jgi:hypothetical protein
MFKFKPLTIALATLAATSVANAGNIYIEATGFGLDQQTSVQNIPGVDSTPNTALYMLPRLGNYGGGPGWPATLKLVLDDTTGAPSSFSMILDSDQVFGSGGPQSDIRYAGRNYSSVDLGPNGANCQVDPASIDFSGDFLNTRPAVPAGGDGSGTTGQLVIHCPGAGLNTSFFAQLNDRTGVCATEAPFAVNSLTVADNGCSAAWVGDATGVAVAPQVATAAEVCLSDAYDSASLASGNNFGAEWARPHQAKSANGVEQNMTIDLGNGGGPETLSLYAAYGANFQNAPMFCSTNRHQNALRQVEHELRGGRGSGTFIISHTGSLAGGDFAATDIDYVHDVDGASVGQSGPFEYQSFTMYDFTSVEQSGGGTQGKNVPAMGAFGLVALFGGLVAVAARLRRRVS